MFLYEKWIPADNLPNAMFLYAFYNDWEGVRVLLKGTEKTEGMLRLLFEAPLSYRRTQRHNKLQQTNQIDHLMNADSGFFIIRASDYINWFNDESYDIYQGDNVLHYVIYTKEVVIELLSAFAPISEWL